MSMIAMPKPDAAVIGRRAQIVKDLAQLIGAASVIGDDDGRRAFETDGLTAYRCMPLAVTLPRSTIRCSVLWLKSASVANSS